jgi:outer membrane protein OmpA-like peptidoglycan-associated protein
MRLVVLFAMLLLAACHVAGPEHVAVFFPERSSMLDPQARQVIATVADRARQRPGTPVVLIGYAGPDAAATLAGNLALAARRAKAVADLLVADGVDPRVIRRHATGNIDYALDSIESRRVEIALGEP